MRILYLDLNPNSIPGRTDEILRDRGHMLLYVRTCGDAIEMIRNQDVDAVVIAQDSLEVLTFVAKANAVRGELPVFVTDDWSITELPLALEWCGERQDAADHSHA